MMTETDTTSNIATVNASTDTTETESHTNKIVVKSFKSERAAKVAMTKAEKAYETARDAVNAVSWAYRDGGMTWDDFLAKEKAAEKVKDVAWAYAQAVYDQARSQGFWVRSWHFGVNPTRDLIAANMD